MKKLALFSILCLLTFQSMGQTIFLINPSFEDLPRPGKAPKDWNDCGFPGETPPDIQPDPTFSVTTKPYDGGSYLGMVVRDNETWESVSQQLESPLVKDQCYAFSIMMARSETYISVSRTSDEIANYSTPVVLKIWGGNDHCEKGELLAFSEVVSSYKWKEYPFVFHPLKDWTHLLLEAFYEASGKWIYNGNLLLDKASGLTRVDCAEINLDSLTFMLSKNINPVPPQESKVKASVLAPDINFDTNKFYKPNSVGEMEELLIENVPLIQFGGDATLIYQNIFLAQTAIAINTFSDMLFIIAVQNDDLQYKTRLLREAFQKHGITNNLLIIRAVNEADAERDWLVNGEGNGLMIRYVDK